ncbi:hypothetical protein GCM10027062_09220 [Nocardioides hungaricus]
MDSWDTNVPAAMSGAVECAVLQVLADLVGAAGVRLRVGGVVPELADVVAERGQVGDLLLDVFETCVEEVAHVLAGGLAVVADVEDLVWRIGAWVSPAAWPRWMKSIRSAVSGV